MGKLNQVNALVAGKKSEATKIISELYKLLQKEVLFDGRLRTYKPLDEEKGERFPQERQIVQQRVKPLINQASDAWTELFDLIATQDSGNQQARADIVADGKLVLADVPVTTLLFLEKQLNDIETFISKLPTPDPSEEWEYDPNIDGLKSRAAVSVKTKKVPRNHVKAEATDKFPAQVEVYTEDIVVGNWTQVFHTGRIPSKEKNVYLHNVRQLRDAVKLAREQANSVDVKPTKIGRNLFNFVFGSTE